MAKTPAKKPTTGTKSRSRKKADPDPAVESAEANAAPEKPKRRSRKKPTTTEVAAESPETPAESKPKRRSRKKPASGTATSAKKPATGSRARKTAASDTSEEPPAKKPPRRRKTAAATEAGAEKPATRRKASTNSEEKPAEKPARRRSVKGKAPVATPDSPQASVVKPRVSGTVTVRQKSNLYTQRIDQIGAAYSMIEDRVLVSISRKDRSGVKMWLTRRATNHLWHAMMKVLERRPDVAAQKSPVSKKAVMEFQQTSAVQTNDPKKPFRKEDLMYPHGEEPLVVHSFTCGPDAEGLLQVTLRFGKEREFTTSLDLRMVYLFCDLLANSSKKMDWGLTFGEEPTPKKEAEPAAAVAGKPVVH